jgi:MFS family permease
MADSLGYPVSSVYAAFSVALIVAALSVPFAGKYVDAYGGKRVLAASNIWFAVSLVFLSRAQSEAGLFLGWASLGVAMGAGLYDMAFATVVRSRGSAAPPVIAGNSLLVGFSSTLGWPVSHYLLSHFDWRQVLLAWAGAHIFLALPLNLSLVLPMQPRSVAPPKPDDAFPRKAEKSKVPAMLALALAFAFSYFCTGALVGHLPGLLQLFGVGVAASILAGMAFGPAQVSARLLLLAAQQKIRPINAAILAMLIVSLGAATLALSGPGVATLVVITLGFGNGIMTIIKGTLPLSIFGEKGYGRRQGLLFLPAGIALALAPFLFSLCIEVLDKDALYVFIAAALMAALLFLCLKRLAR